MFQQAKEADVLLTKINSHQAFVSKWKSPHKSPNDQHDSHWEHGTKSIQQALGISLPKLLPRLGPNKHSSISYLPYPILSSFAFSILVSSIMK